MICDNTLNFKNPYRVYLRDAITNNIVREEHGYNLVTNAGLRLALDLLGGVAASTVHAVSYGAVGTGAGAAALTDVALTTELERNEISYSRAAEVGTFSLFFATGEANDTITEFGFFGGAATDTAGTGTLFNRVLLAAPIAKDSNYTLSIELDLTLANV